MSEILLKLAEGALKQLLRGKSPAALRAHIRELAARIEQLEAENAGLRRRLAPNSSALGPEPKSPTPRRGDPWAVPGDSEPPPSEG